MCVSQWKFVFKNTTSPKSYKSLVDFQTSCEIHVKELPTLGTKKRKKLKEIKKVKISPYVTVYPQGI